MQITVKVLGVEEENKGKYQMLTVSYKDVNQGKVAEKKLISFNAKDVYAAFKNANAGDQFDVEIQKNDKGYWDWISIGKPGAAPSVASGATKTTGNAAPKSSYETAEERAARQVMIVRQSSLSTAATVLKTDKKQPTGDEVIALAKEFEAYVLGLNLKVPTEPLPELPEDDDIPY